MKPLPNALSLLLLLASLLVVQSLVAEVLRADQGPGRLPDSQLVYISPVHQPHWNGVLIEDDGPKRLLTVPEGKRFILTDIWFLSREDEVITSSPQDRVWLENRSGAERFIVFDSPRSELPAPIRWETGISFPPKAEMWINYRAASETNRLRRVLYSGYFEAVTKP